MNSKIKSLDNKDVGEIDLKDSIFALPARPDILHRIVRWQLARRQEGTHKTKTVSEIRGTTSKPWNQKGTGRARAGSIRSTQFRGGAVAHGPTFRSHSIGLPKKVRRLALKTALSTKNNEGKLIVIDKLSIEKLSTNSLSKKFNSLGWRSALIIDSNGIEEGFLKSIRNIPNFDVLPHQGINVYDILKKDLLVLTKSAVDALQVRLS